MRFLFHQQTLKDDHLWVFQYIWYLLVPNNSELHIIVGGPGGGKTWMLANVGYEALSDHPYPFTVPSSSTICPEAAGSLPSYLFVFLLYFLIFFSYCFLF